MGWLIGGVFAMPVLFFIAVYIRRVLIHDLRAQREPPALGAGQQWQGRFSSMDIRQSRPDGLYLVEMFLWSGDQVVTVTCWMDRQTLTARILGDDMVIAKPAGARLGQEAHA